MNKNIFALLLFVFVVLSMSSISAADLDENNQTLALDSGSVIAESSASNSNVLKNDNNEILEISDSDDVLEDDEVGSFTELRSLLSGSSEIILTKDYKYYATDMRPWIEINQPTIIHGDGHSIDFSSVSGQYLLNPYGNSLSLDNITIMNGHAVYYAVYVNNLSNVRFINLTGESIVHRISENVIIEDCYFFNNTAEYMISGNTFDSHNSYERNIFLNNNVSQYVINDYEVENFTHNGFINNKNENYISQSRSNKSNYYYSPGDLTITGKDEIDHDSDYSIRLPKEVEEIPQFNITVEFTSDFATVDLNTITFGEGRSYDWVRVSPKTWGTGTLIIGPELVNIGSLGTKEISNQKRTEIILENESFDLKVNEEVAAGASLNPADAGNLTYTSSNETVVKVVDGNITAVGAGSATITVSFAGNNEYKAAQNKTIAVSVSLYDASVSVDKNTASIYVDEYHQIYATRNPGNLNIKYESNDISVASVDETGRVTAHNEGTAVITLTVGDDKTYAKNSTTVTVTVSKIPTEIKLNNESFDLKVGSSEIHSGASLNVTGATPLIYTSSDDTIVKVEQGYITAVNAGNANITVSFAGDDKYKAAQNKTIYVYVYSQESSVRVENNTASIEIDENYTIEATAVPENLTISYVSNDTSVASVNETGVVTGLKEGTALITLNVGGDNGYAKNSTTVTVTVNKVPTEIKLNNESFDLKVNEEVASGASLNVTDDVLLNYTSSNATVVKVENGKIIAVSVGSATVTVSFAGDNKYGAAKDKKITVSVSLNDASVSVEEGTASIYVDENYTINATTVPENLTISYSSDSDVASVDENGVVTGLKEGTAVITLTVGDDRTYAVNSTTVTVSVSKIPTEINLEKNLINLNATEKVASGASLNPPDAGDLIYTSSDENIVKVENGKIIAVSVGNATVTVSFAGDDKYEAAADKTIDVTVSLNDASVSVDEGTASIEIDDTYTIEATTVPEDLTISYVSNDTSVASVDENGVVTGLKEGTVLITLTVGDDKVYAVNSTTVTVNVSKVPTEIKLENVSFDLKVNEEVASGASLNVTDDVLLNYTSSNETVVIVVDGKIIAVSVGNATITVSFAGNDKYKTAADNKTITVSVSLNDASVSVEENTVSIEIDEKYTIDATTNPTNLPINYTSNDTSVASVDKNGVVTGLKEGTTVITLTVGDDKVYAVNSTTVTVTVSKISTEIKLVNDSVDLKVKGEVGTGASLNPTDAGNLTYISSDENIVKVVDGNIIAVIAGNATVTVSFAGNDKYKAAEDKTIYVSVSPIDASVSVDKDTASIYVDDGHQIHAAANPGNLNIKYASNDTSVASVEPTGRVTAHKEGTALITLTVGDDKTYAKNSTTVTVTVSKIPTEIKLKNESFDLKINSPVIHSGASLNITGVTPLIYTSSDDTIVKVEQGYITAVSVGNATVTVSFAGNDKYKAAEDKTIYVTVSPLDASVSVDEDTASIEIDGKYAIDATTVPEDLTISYVSNDTSVASVDENGVVTGLNEGTVLITLTVGDDKTYAVNSTTVTVSVSKVPTEIKLVKESFDLKVADEVDVGASLLPADAGDLIYTSSDEDIVKVENGKIIAVGAGNATVTVSFAGNDKFRAADDKIIYVTVSPLDASVVANPDSLDLFVGESKEFHTSTTPEDLDIVVSSSNESVATVKLVNRVPTVTAVGAGSAVITVTINEDDYVKNSTTVTVSVSKVPTEIKLDEESFALKVNDGVDVGASLVPADAGDLIYTSSDENIVKVENCKIIAVGAGNATVTVSFAGDDKYEAADDKIIDVAVSLNDASVSVDEDTASIEIDGKYAIDATTVPEDLTISYVSNDTSVASVDKNGVVTGLKEGTVLITLTVGDDKVYAVNSTAVTVSVSKVPTNITAKADSELLVGGDSKVNYTLTPGDATGKVTFTSSNPKVVSVDAEGKISALGEGSAVISVAYAGSDKYAPSSTTVSIKVSKATIKPEITANDTTVTVSVPEDATGNVALTVGDETFTAPIENGAATFDLSDVPAGDYNATVSYPGDDKYEGFDEKVPVSIESKYALIAENVTKYYGGSERFVVQLTDGEGNPIANESVEISINGEKYTRITDANGTTSIGINLNSGEYPVMVSALNMSVNAKVTVLPTINANDVTKVFRNATQYHATFCDSEGKYLKEGTLVRFNIHGVMYNRSVDKNGTASLNINLEHGEYIITAMNPVTGEASANIITVIPRIIENYDLTKYYRNASQYSVKVIDDKGKAVGAGEEVTFNINGVFYTRTTDESGIAKLNINLQPGDYIITAVYGECMVSNKIKVLPVLSADNLTKKYGTNDQFVATLVDGQGNPYANQSIQFNINGVFYYRTTDSTGQAKLNINLQAGKYIITSSYNESSIANTVTVIS